MSRAGKSRATPTPVTQPPVVPPPSLHPLCEDTVGYLWELLCRDAVALAAAARLNKAWHAAAVARGAPVFLRPVDYEPNPSKTAAELTALSLTHPGASRLCARDSGLTDDDLRRLGKGLLPALASLDVSGCQHMLSHGVVALVRGLGPRLKDFAQDTTRRHSLCKEMRVTKATLKALAAAPCLERLSLTLGSGVKSGLEAFHGHASLRRLTLCFEGFQPPLLPRSLPALEWLIIITGGFSTFSWPSGGGVPNGQWDYLQFPKLALFEIYDHIGDYSPGLQRDGLEALRAIFPAARVRLLHAGPRSGISPAELPLEVAGDEVIGPLVDG